MKLRSKARRKGFWIFALATLPACECTTTTPSATPDAAIEAGAAMSGSIACFAADGLTCNEYPRPTIEQANALTVACSSGSGALTRPAACPTAKFGGKCTRPAAEGNVERFYTGAGSDLAYAQDFCVNTASGAWSTTF